MAETNSLTVLSTAIHAEGTPARVCTGCHMRGQSHITHAQDALSRHIAQMPRRLFVWPQRYFMRASCMSQFKVTSCRSESLHHTKKSLPRDRISMFSSTIRDK